MKRSVYLQQKNNSWLTRFMSIFLIIVCILGSASACSSQQEEPPEAPSLPAEQDEPLEQMKEVLKQAEVVHSWYNEKTTLDCEIQEI